MRKPILVLGLLLVLPAAGYSAEPRPREIVVSGEAMVKVPSDRVMISATISAVQKNYKNAVNEVEGKLKSAVEALRKLGISDKWITYADLSANPHYEYTERGAKLTGFEVTRSLVVQLESLELLGSAFEVLLAAHVTAVHGPSYEVRERDAAYRKALVAAAADAEAKAQALARERGVAGLQLVRLEEEGSMEYAPQPMLMRSMKVESADMATPAFSDNVSSIRARVRAVYAFSN